jgi:hypothetical protein
LKVPFGDLKIHYQSYRTILKGAVERVLESGYFILGPELKRFEKDFARFVGVEHAVGCASGTEAIYLALAALNVTADDEVIVVAHTAGTYRCSNHFRHLNDRCHSRFCRYRSGYLPDGYEPNRIEN